MKEFDAAIIGGGPAGATTGLCLAQRGWRVALFESTNFNEVHFDSPRYGETFPPEITPLLRDLGVWPAFTFLAPLESPGIVSAWGGAAPHEQDFIDNVHGRGWNISRNLFDAMLCREAEKAGVTVFRGCPVRTWERDGPGAWRLRAGSREAPHEIHPQFVVVASGQNGLRMAGCYGRKVEDVLLAMVLRLTYPGGPPTDLRTCIESTSDGWWYWAPAHPQMGVAMFFTSREIYRNGICAGEQLQDAPLLRTRLSAGRIASQRLVRATSALNRHIAGDGWATVGDSASSYDPLSGMGVFKALHQGRAAAAAIHEYLGGRKAALLDYAESVSRDFEKYAEQRRLYYASERRWPDGCFWKMRQFS